MKIIMYYNNIGRLGLQNKPPQSMEYFSSIIIILGFDSSNSQRKSVFALDVWKCSLTFNNFYYKFSISESISQMFILFESLKLKWTWTDLASEYKAETKF